MAKSGAGRLIRWLGLWLNGDPKVLIHFELVKIGSWVASATTEEINWVTMSQEYMWVPRWWNQHAWKIDMCPLLSAKVKIEKVIQLSCTIVPSKQVHSLSHDGGRSPVPWLWPKSISSDLKPLPLSKIELVQIVAVVSIIASKNVQLIIIDNGRVWMTRRGTSLRISDLLHAPLARVNTISMEIINSIETVIPPEYVYLPLIDDGSVPVARWRWRIINRQYLSPLIRLKIKLKEIVPPISAIISTKNVKIVIKRHRGM